MAVIGSKPFYWLECDEPSCDKRSPEEDDEVTAWGGPDIAVSVAVDSEWLAVGSKHYCEDHAPAHEKEKPIDGQELLI